MLYTGPGGRGDYRPHLLVDQRPVTTNPYSREATYDTGYLWRPAPGTPFHKRRTSCAGEIGWSAWAHPDYDAPSTGHQIFVSEFWRQVEDAYTHRFQVPWYWHPSTGRDTATLDRPFGPVGYVYRPKTSPSTTRPQPKAQLTARFDPNVRVQEVWYEQENQSSDESNNRSRADSADRQDSSNAIRYSHHPESPAASRGIGNNNNASNNNNNRSYTPDSANGRGQGRASPIARSGERGTARQEHLL